MSAPCTPFPGVSELDEVRLTDSAFEPSIDLVADGVVLATLFYDDKPECAYASVEIEDENGDLITVSGAEAGLDENEVGWCLQYTDASRHVQVISRMPRSWEEQALGCAWVLIAARVDEHGLWEPADGFRLWERVEDEE